MGNESRGIGLVQVVWILAGLLVVVATGFHIFHSIRTSSVKFSTPYQAVLLTNGSVYFGHLQDYGTSHPILTDVFYVASQTNPETKQVNNVLVKRGTELHEPDRIHQPEPDRFCGDGGHKLNRCPAHCPGTALIPCNRHHQFGKSRPKSKPSLLKNWDRPPWQSRSGWTRQLGRPRFTLERIDKCVNQDLVRTKWNGS
jgi:hypothetical protein